MSLHPFLRLMSLLTKDGNLRMLEYVLAENRLYRSMLNKRPCLTPLQKEHLATLAKGIPRNMLKRLSTFVSPETLYRWHREAIRKKWDYSKRRGPGRPGTRHKIVRLVVQWAFENPGWGYSRLQGALRENGFKVSRQTIANILKKQGMLPSPQRERHTTWGEFIRRHKKLLVGCDFFTTEVWEGLNLVTYYVLFFVHLGTRKVHIAGITPHPDGPWMRQVARNLTMEGSGPALSSIEGFLRKRWWVLHDRGGQFCQAFLATLQEAGVHTLRLPYQSPNMNAFAERWVRSVKEECLSKLILVGEPMLRNALKEYVEHYHKERTHQGVGNVILFPEAGPTRGSPKGRIARKSRLGGLLNYYHREAG